MFFGVKTENIVMFNSKGALRKDDPRVTDMQRRYATDKHYDDLAQAMKGADVFGLSSGDIVTPEMLLSMANNPIVFALANPIQKSIII
jgi:malate dehydrogenase (oxaloacetate-decarboxylating)(NADP+)